MNEASRRRICRTLFLLLALAPCCAVLAAAAWQSSHWAEERWRENLRRELGVHVQWANMANSLPGEICWEGLQMSDVDSAALLAEIDVCTMTERGDRLRLAPGRIEVPAATADAVLSTLQCALGRDASGVDIETCEVNLLNKDGTSAASWTLLQAESWKVDSGRKAIIRCRPANGPEVAVHVERTEGSRALRIVIDTKQRALPLKSLHLLLPRLPALGSEATFQGAVQCVQKERGWDMQIHGLLNHIDLESLVNRHTKQHLTGAAALEIESAQFTNGKLVAAKGRLGAADGEINYGLLSDASGRFGFPCDYSKQFLDERRFETIRYGQLLVQFDVRQGTVELTGLIEPGQAPLSDEQGGTLLRAAPKGVRPPLALAVQLLYPTDDAKVTASRESFWLASWLELPAAGQLREWTPPQPPPPRSSPRNLLRQHPAGDP